MPEPDHNHRRILRHHAAALAVFIDDQLLGSHRLWQTLAFVFDDNCGRSAIVFGVAVLQPGRLDLFESQDCGVLFLAVKFERTSQQVANKIVIDNPLVCAEAAKAVGE